MKCKNEDFMKGSDFLYLNNLLIKFYVAENSQSINSFTVMNAVSELSVTESSQPSNSQHRICLTIRGHQERCSSMNESFAELLSGAIFDNHTTTNQTDLFRRFFRFTMSAQSILTYLFSWITFLLRNGEGMYDHAKHSEGPVMLWEYSSVTRITTPLVMDVVQENVHCKSFLLRLHCQKCCSWSTRLEDIVWISRFFVSFDQNYHFHQPIPDRQVGKRTQNDPACPYRAQSWVYDNMFFSELLWVWVFK